MAQVSDEEVQAAQERVAKLRQQVEDAERLRVQNETEQHNAILVAELGAEEARLQAQLAEAKSRATKTAAREGAANPLEAARAAQAAAREQQKAAEKQANTNVREGE